MGGHDAGDGQVRPRLQAQVLGLKQVAQQDAVFVGRGFLFGANPPVADELVVLIDPDHRVGVADVHDDEQRGYLQSKGFKLWESRKNWLVIQIGPASSFKAQMSFNHISDFLGDGFYF